MKRWLLVGIPLVIFGALLFVKPPTFTSYKTPPTTSSIVNSGSTTSPGNKSAGVKPNIGGNSYGDEVDEHGLVNGQKPVYGGHEADKYDNN